MHCMFDHHVLLYTGAVKSSQYIDTGMIQPVNVCLDLSGNVQFPLFFLMVH